MAKKTKTKKQSTENTVKTVVLDNPVIELVEQPVVEPPKVITTEDAVATLEKLKQELKDKKAQAREVEKQKKFYQKYPHVINGSIREPSEDERKSGFVHGKVCDILCACSAKRTINTQDAFQVFHCHDCFAKLKKSEAKKKREAKRNSPEKLLAQKQKLEKQLAQMQVA